MNGLQDCWECGRPAPSGVCVGPHEGFTLDAARLALNVGGTTMEWGVRKPRNPCRVCGAVCRGERVTCGDACYTANLASLMRGRWSEGAYEGVTVARPASPTPRRVVPEESCSACGYRLSDDGAYTWCDRCAWEPGDSNGAPTSAARAAS